MKTIKRLLLGLTLGMLLVGCSTEPITETQQQVAPINIPGPTTGTFCKYTTYSHSVDIPPTGNLADVSLTTTMMYYNRKTTLSSNIRPDGTIIDPSKVTQSVITKTYPGLSRFDINVWICN